MYLPLFCLLLGAFSIGTTELVVAGLLPPIAADLGVSIAEAGLLVSGYALGVVVGGPAMMAVAGRWPRKPAILAVLAIFLVAHLVCALAPGFAVLMAGRVLAAAAHGCFFGLAIVLATGLVPADRRATALSIVVGGISVANIVGVPLGTAVGNAFGWRAAFVMIAGFTLLAAAAIAAFVPDAAGPRGRMPLAGQLRALANRMVLGAYAMIVLLMIAFFSLLTFIAPYLAEVAGIGADRLPAILMALGVAGGVGMFAGGQLTDLNPNRSLVAGFALSAAALALAWVAMPWSAAVGVAAIAALELFGSVAALAAQHRVLVGAFRAPELASTLMSSVFNVGIAAGAGLGAWALAAGMPVARLPAIGLAALVAAGALAVAAVLVDRRTP
jgi:MFS transporter, DHA1 family, inner membrane transport protein